MSPFSDLFYFPHHDRTHSHNPPGLVAGGVEVPCVDVMLLCLVGAEMAPLLDAVFPRGT